MSDKYVWNRIDKLSADIDNINTKIARIQEDIQEVIKTRGDITIMYEKHTQAIKLLTEQLSQDYDNKLKQAMETMNQSVKAEIAASTHL